MSISSAPSRNTTSSAPASAICAARRARRAPGTKPRSSAPTREAAVCSTEKPFQPSVTAPSSARLGRERGDRRAVRPRQRAHADDHQRALGLLEHLAELVAAGRDVGQRLRPGAEIVVGIGEVGPLADQADREAAHAPALADAGVEHGRFPARIGADEQQRIGLLDAGDGGVEQIARPAPARIERGAVLPAVEIGDAEPRHQVLEREDFLDRGEIADDGADALGVARSSTLAAMASKASRQDAGRSRPFSRM